jgi:hypothetical protein
MVETLMAATLSAISALANTRKGIKSSLVFASDRHQRISSNEVPLATHLQILQLS